MFELKLSVFEGPLDLLLHLIEREDLDITTVSLVQVTDQYMAYLHSGEQIDVRALAEFVAVGAKLLYLKSRALLPRPPQAESVEPGEEDVGEELTRLLKEYKRFKEAAEELRYLEERGFRAYPRLAPPPDTPLPLGLDGVTMDLLVKIFQEALERQPEEPLTIQREEVTVEQKVEEISGALGREGQVSFRRLVSSCRSRVEVIVSFLAVLELIKALRIRAQQDDLFGDIVLVSLGVAAAGG